MPPNLSQALSLLKIVPKKAQKKIEAQDGEEGGNDEDGGMEFDDEDEEGGKEETKIEPILKLKKRMSHIVGIPKH